MLAANRLLLSSMRAVLDFQVYAPLISRGLREIKTVKVDTAMCRIRPFAGHDQEKNPTSGADHRTLS